jgi:hypothetical protein
MLIGAIAVTTTSAPAMAATQPVAADAATKSSSPRAFASLSVPKRTLYDGESVPVTLQAYYRAGTGVTLTGRPKPSDPSFTLTLGDPSQGRATIAGETYLVVTWKGRLSPVKAGRYALKLEIANTLEWQDVVPHSARSAASDENFDDPFGGDLFAPFGQSDPSDLMARMQQQMQKFMNHAFQDLEVGPVQKRELTLESPAADLNVLPLPAAGRPPTFAGAVGHFDVTATTNATRVRAGEPVELRLLVGGRGNFDRVALAGVPSTSDLETYAPTATSGDGSKTFVQAIVPRRAGLLQIPSVDLDYFDPDAGKYVTAHSHAIPIDVSPGQALATTASGTVPEATSGPVLAANELDAGRAVASLRPLFARRTFWLAQLAPLGALVAGVTFVLGRRRLAGDPRRSRQREAQRTLRRYRAEMDRAAGQGDASAFFAAARRAVQQAIAARYDIHPSAVTPAEIERRGQVADLDTLRGVFEADATRFGHGVTETDLSRWNAAVHRELARTEQI